jgi:hypothetical protein
VTLRNGHDRKVTAKEPRRFSSLLRLPGIVNDCPPFFRFGVEEFRWEMSYFDIRFPARQEYK